VKREPPAPPRLQFDLRDAIEEAFRIEADW
jgi:hypothetical protein